MSSFIQSNQLNQPSYSEHAAYMQLLQFSMAQSLIILWWLFAIKLTFFPCWLHLLHVFKSAFKQLHSSRFESFNKTSMQRHCDLKLLNSFCLRNDFVYYCIKYWQSPPLFWMQFFVSFFNLHTQFDFLNV